MIVVIAFPPVFAFGDLPSALSPSAGCLAARVRLLYLRANLVIWKVHNSSPRAAPSAIYIQPMHDSRYYLPDEVDVFSCLKISDEFLTV